MCAAFGQPTFCFPGWRGGGSWQAIPCGMLPFAVTRLLDRPIITPETHPSIGENIQGPSLLRVPDWLPGALGRYYLYFADHEGSYIRLAYADDVLGPWAVYPSGTLHLPESGFPVDPPVVDDEQISAAINHIARLGITLSYDPIPDMMTPHIASPDVHVDHDRREIVMYFHGLQGFNVQKTRVGVSADGIRFAPVGDTLPNTYLRAFGHDGFTYALTMPGRFYRSGDGRSQFEKGPLLFEPNMRHCALVRRGSLLHVLWTRVTDVPESILCSTIDLTPDWHDWTATHHGVILAPEEPWEGALEPRVPSERGKVMGPVNQLRDPCVFEEDENTYLLYSVAGEHGIAIARLTDV
jgi:hypothetical protein